MSETETFYSPFIPFFCLGRAGTTPYKPCLISDSWGQYHLAGKQCMSVHVCVYEHMWECIHVHVYVHLLIGIFTGLSQSYNIPSFNIK